jgi:hypothetical protein
MFPAMKALVESDIFYRAGAMKRAPKGLYTLEREGVRVGFSRGESKFSLPLDTVVMHVFEGRMRLLEGKLI